MRTRFAPSPTGYLHLGGARTALFNWLLARHHGGEFLIRLEDSDQERSRAEFAEQILAAFQWLGIASDAPIWRQSQRLQIYRDRAEELVRAGKAYRCLCTPEQLEQLRAQQIARGEKPRYDGRYRESNISADAGAHTIRLKNPLEGSVVFHDLVHGDIATANAELDDLVLIRSDGFPTYNFCCVVDDHEQAITHVVRGDDHIINSARQINIYQALGYTAPQFAHLPMILGADGKRLSKRHAALSVLEYKDSGVLAQALVNYLARLGWSSGDKELFSIAELIASFDFGGLQRSPASFDPVKLQWVNQQHLHQLQPQQLAELLAKAGTAELVVDQLEAIALHQQRASNLQDLQAQMHYLTDASISVDAKLVQEYAPSAPLLTELVPVLQQLPNWQAEELMAAIKSFAKGQGVKMPAVGMPLRVALTGSAQAPAINAICALLGRNLTCARVQEFIAASTRAR